MDEPDIEEERRLLYVGITRAMKELYATYTTGRTRFGRTQPSIPSSFLKELVPAGETAPDAFERLRMDAETERRLFHRAPSTGSVGGWKRRLRPASDDFDDDPHGTEEDFVDPPPPEESFDDPFSDDECPPEDLADGFEVHEPPFPPGARVRHDDYGAGEVVRSSGLGPRLHVSVRFEDGSELQFVLPYADLRRLR